MPSPAVEHLPDHFGHLSLSQVAHRSPVKLLGEIVHHPKVESVSLDHRNDETFLPHAAVPLVGVGRFPIDLYLCFLDLIGSVFSLVFVRDEPRMNDLRINGGLKKSVGPFGLLSDLCEICHFGLHRDAEAVVGECGQTQPLVVSRIEVGQP